MGAEWTARLPAGAGSGVLVSRDTPPRDPAADAREIGERAEESSRLAFRVAWSVLRDRAEAEEVAQEALLRAHRHGARLREPERFQAWLVRVAWRLALDRTREARRRARREREAARQVAALTGRAQPKEFHFALAEEIERLPRKLRAALLLAAVEGYDTREVARRLGVPEGTVKSRLFAARARLAERLEWAAGNTERR